MIALDDRTLPDRSPAELRALAGTHAARFRRRRRHRAAGAAGATVLALLATLTHEPQVEVRTTRPADVVEEATGAAPSAPSLPVPRKAPAVGAAPSATTTTTGTAAARDEPATQPDGPKPARPHTKLLFVRGSGGLWELSLDDGSSRLLQDAGFDGRWSPDGRRVVLETGMGLALLDVESGERTTLFEQDYLEHDTFHRPAWLPDGNAIVFQQSRQTGVTTWTTELWVIEVATREMRLLRVGSNPSVARDGRILYSCDHGEWCLTDAAGADLGVVVNSQGFSDAVLSPDGRRLVGHRPGSSGADLVVQQLDGWGRRVLLSGRTEGRPAWFPDGTRVAFKPRSTHSLEPPGETGIWSVRTDGTDVRRHTDGKGDRSPDLVHAH